MANIRDSLSHFSGFCLGWTVCIKKFVKLKSSALQIQVLVDCFVAFVSRNDVLSLKQKNVLQKNKKNQKKNQLQKESNSYKIQSDIF